MMGKEGVMRLFIAIELTHGMRAELAGLLKELKERSCGGRFVPPENFHVTMHFIGESNDLAGACAAMRDAVRGIRPFELKLGRYGFFDKVSGGKRTGLVEVAGDIRELGILHETLESALSDRGFSRDNKRFKPHITLGRNVEHDELVTEELRSRELTSSMLVTGLTLFESTRVNGRQVYTPLHRESFE